jgi:hypothetical protein
MLDTGGFKTVRQLWEKVEGVKWKSEADRKIKKGNSCVKFSVICLHKTRYFYKYIFEIS